MRPLATVLPKAIKLASASLMLMALWGCSQLNTITSGPLNGKTSISTIKITGTTQFVCHRDEQGAFWKFVQLSGRLTDMSGRVLGQQTNPQTLVDRQHREAHLQQVALLNKNNADNLPELLFEIQPNTIPWLKHATYLTRENTRGGLPLTGCSPSQKGQILNVKFSANYRLWK